MLYLSQGSQAVSSARGIGDDGLIRLVQAVVHSYYIYRLSERNKSKNKNKKSFNDPCPFNKEDQNSFISLTDSLLERNILVSNIDI